MTEVPKTPADDGILLRGIPGPGLGLCGKCRGHLCVSQQRIVCERCGHHHPEHPKSVDWQALQESGKGKTQSPPRDVQAQDYPASYFDRINGLERLTKAQAAAIAALERRIAALEGSPQAALEANVEKVNRKREKAAA